VQISILAEGLKIDFDEALSDREIVNLV